MININSYIEKLEWLKEWIAKRIDGTLPSMMDGFVEINFAAIPIMSVDEVMKIYRQTGVLFYRDEPKMSSSSRLMNFDEYCIYKQSLK